MSNRISSATEEISNIHEERNKKLNDIHEREFRDAFEKHSKIIEKKVKVNKKLEKMRDRLVSIMNRITDKDKKHLYNDFTIRDGDLYSYHSEEEIKLEKMFEQEAFEVIIEGIIVDCVNSEHRYDFEDVFKYCKNVYNGIGNNYLYCTEVKDIPEEYKMRNAGESENHIVYSIDKKFSNVRKSKIEIFGVSAKSKRNAKLKVENPSVSNRRMRVYDCAPSDEERFIQRVQHLKNIEILLSKAERDLDKRLDRIEDCIQKIDKRFEEMIIATKI